MDESFRVFVVPPAAYRTYNFYLQRLLDVHSRFGNILSSCNPPLTELISSELKPFIEESIPTLRGDVELLLPCNLCSVFTLPDLVQNPGVIPQIGAETENRSQIFKNDRPQVMIYTLDIHTEDMATAQDVCTCIQNRMEQVIIGVPPERRPDVIFFIDIEITQGDMVNQVRNILPNADGVVFGDQKSDLPKIISKRLEERVLDLFLKMDHYCGSFTSTGQNITHSALETPVEDISGTFEHMKKSPREILDILKSGCKPEEDVTKLEPSLLVDKLLDGFSKRLKCAVVEKMSRCTNLKPSVLNAALLKLKFEDNLKKATAEDTRNIFEQIRKETIDYYKPTSSTSIGRKRKRIEAFGTKRRRHSALGAMHKFQELAEVIDNASKEISTMYKAVKMLKKLKYEIGGSVKRMNPGLCHDRSASKLSPVVVEGLSRIKEVKGFGVICGLLHIHIEKHSNGSWKETETKSEVRKALKACNYPYRYVIEIIIKSPKQYSPEMGTCLLNGEKPIGTLGGFMEVEEPDRNVLYGMTCAHVAVQVAPDQFLYVKTDEGQKVKLGKRKWSTANEPPFSPFLVDMSAIEVHEECRQHFRNYYKNAQKEPCPGQVFQGEANEVSGEPVFKYGFKTSLTHGIIADEGYYIKHGDLLKKGVHILVCPKPGGGEEKFADSGDSGSIVLRQQEDGSVELISMVNAGEFKLRDDDGTTEEFCMSFLVSKGLQKLEKRSKTKFKVPRYDSEA